MNPAAGTAHTGTTPKVLREVFRTSRLLDFVSEKELIAQTGHGTRDWPLVILKELLDNALDACEEAGIAPRITVTVDDAGIAVQDNGPGLPTSVVTDVLDFSCRVSSREAFVSPSRGAQGNALKTLIAMPYVLDGKQGRVEIGAHGIRHDIQLRVDRVRQEPVIEHQKRPDDSVQNGTLVRIHWPNSPCSQNEKIVDLYKTADDDEYEPEPQTPDFLLQKARYRIQQLAENYTFLNPHLSLTLNWHGEITCVSATQPGWEKWRPDNPTCAHWYEPAHLERLFAAYLVHDVEHGHHRSVRDIVATFWGLSRSTKKKAVLNESGLLRKPLAALATDESGIDQEAIERLLSAMKRHSKPVKPKALGVIGKEQVAARFTALGGETETLEYRRFAGMLDGLPCVIEVAFAWSPKIDERMLVTGINWSPGIANPFGDLGVSSHDLGTILEEQRVSDSDPVLVLVHLACPRVDYTDRGKSNVVLADMGDKIIELVKKATARWTKQRKAEERDQNRKARRRQSLIRSSKVAVKEAAYKVMEAAYMKASNDNTLPAQARQIMYAARGPIQELTGQSLDDKYFTQTLLPGYMNENPETTTTWDVVFDARGHLHEPHTGRSVALGTVGVRNYLAGKAANPSLYVPTATLYPTHGPEHRFNAILFIEKEGFLPIFNATSLADRFDLAIMSSKGQSSTACRMLADELCASHNVPLLVLHDFDKAGFSICGMFRRSNSRYRFKHKIKVVDLGLRLKDIQDNKLDAEDVSVNDSDAMIANLRLNGANEEEIAFLCAGRRVELNAFTSAELIAWIEKKLKKHGVKKVIPDDDVLELAYRRAVEQQFIANEHAKIVEAAKGYSKTAPLPNNLRNLVRQSLLRESHLSWDSVVAHAAGSN